MLSGPHTLTEVNIFSCVVRDNYFGQNSSVLSNPITPPIPPSRADRWLFCEMSGPRTLT